MPAKQPTLIPMPDGAIGDQNIYATVKTIVKQLINVSFIENIQDFIADEYRNRFTET